MQEEDTFTEELLEDVEGRIRDFFLGCFTRTEQEDSFESIVRDGKLYGQDYFTLKEHFRGTNLLFRDDKVKVAWSNHH